MLPSLPPTIYRAKGEGGRSLAPSSKEGCGQGGEESILPKAPRRCLPPLGLSLSLISWRMGLLGLVPLAHIGQGAHPYSPCGPPGLVDPLGGPPDPFRHSRYNTDKVRNFYGDHRDLHSFPTRRSSDLGGPPGPFRWSRYNTDDPETCPDGRNRTSYKIGRAHV